MSTSLTGSHTWLAHSLALVHGVSGPASDSATSFAASALASREPESFPDFVASGLEGPPSPKPVTMPGGGAVDGWLLHAPNKAAAGRATKDEVRAQRTRKEERAMVDDAN